MALLKLMVRNALRNRLRSALTIFGMAVAILAFCLLRTVVEAWYLGAEAASPNRLITRNAVSLIMPLPVSYRERIRQVPGVREVGFGNWFAGVYIDEKNFFPRMAVSENFLALYPEFVVSPEQVRDYQRQRNSAIAGRKVVEQYGWKVGDVITIRGNIYPGDWQFVLRGVYRGATPTTDETQFFLRWDYLDETLRKTTPGRAGRVGWYIVQIDDPAQSPVVSAAIDAMFKNSWAETLTETEKAFQLGFVAMTEAIVTGIQMVSFVVIGVILMVLANTMIMTARERMAEYATLKTLGFRGGFITALIAGESVTVAAIGGGIGIALSFPAARVFSKSMGTLLPVIHVSDGTVFMAAGFCLAIGVLAAIFPAWRAVHVHIAEALRHIG